MTKATKYISMMAIAATSSLFSVDVGNFQYLSNKYRPYFPGKQISVASQQSFSQKAKNFVQSYWPLLGQAACLTTGFAIGKIMAPTFEVEANVAGVLAGTAVGILGARSLKKPARNIDYIRYSKNYRSYHKDDFLLSRYPKKKVSSYSHFDVKIYNEIGAEVLASGSIAALALFVKYKCENKYAIYGQESVDAFIARYGGPQNLNIAAVNADHSASQNSARNGGARRPRVISYWWQFWRLR